MAIAAVLLSARHGMAHEDVVPYNVGGKIVTGGHDDILATDNIEQRVFGYDFGEDVLDPYIIGDPGFNNGAFAVGLYPNDGLLPSSMTLGFDVISSLSFWDGTGGVAFSAAPAGVELGLRRGSSTVLVSGTGQSGTTPSIGVTTAGGRLHEHIESQLNFTDGTNPLPPNAPDGLYLVGLKLTMSGLADSDPIYFVYNNNLDEEVHDEGIEWVEAVLVPEPATWLLAVVGTAGVALTAWRRRRGASRRS